MTDIAALERRARTLLPRDIYDYYAGGSGREATLRGNVKAWRRGWLAPRVLRDVSAVSTGVTLPAGLAAAPLRTPVALAPVGFLGHADPGGEAAAARGAALAGALYVLSTRSSTRIEEVAAAVEQAGGQWWFQVYLLRDRELTQGLVRRAAAAGASALVLTADTPVVGRKRRDRGDGVVSTAEFLVNLGEVADLGQAEQSAAATFADIGALARASGLPVVVKGVLRPDDALACAAAGAAGVIVSNHGGRQLDRSLPTALALPDVAAALTSPGRPLPPQAPLAPQAPQAPAPHPGQAPQAPAPAVFVDGGIRSAEDVLAALACGAELAFLGRPMVWALACGGAEGVRELIDGLTADLAHLMALAGAASVADVPALGLGPQARPQGGQGRQSSRQGTFDLRASWNSVEK